MLLIKYVELEYDALYSRNPYPSQEVEIAAELRILRLLQVMLYSAVHNNEPLVNKHTDRAVKKAVLQLLGEVKPTYLVKNKLICNIAKYVSAKWWKFFLIVIVAVNCWEEFMEIARSSIINNQQLGKSTKTSQLVTMEVKIVIQILKAM